MECRRAHLSFARSVLRSWPAGVSDALRDPTLESVDANGDTVRANDNWQTDQQAEIEATTIPPSDPAEAAIIVTLGTGNYTAVVRGKNGAIGVGSGGSL